MIGNIRIFHVCPETDGAGEILPHSFVFPDTFLTLLDKRLKTVCFNLVLAVQSQFLFHFNFYRQSMGIPACFSRYHVALHGAVSRNHILNNTGQHMTDMGLAVCGGRAVIKGVGRAFLAAVHALFKNVVFIPEIFDLFFSVHEV